MDIYFKCGLEIRGRADPIPLEVQSFRLPKFAMLTDSITLCRVRDRLMKC
jgi:hypothetical protein